MDRGSSPAVEGPPLERLTRRLQECPTDFLLPPRLENSGLVFVPAVVSDLLRELGGATLSREQAEVFNPSRLSPPDLVINRLRLILIASWLLHDEWFRGKGYGAAAYSFLVAGLDEPAGLVRAETFIGDPDRREELARLTLRGLGLRPAGESAAQSEDRLSTISTAERQRVIQAARAAEERAREVREAMAKKEAEEAAAKYSRE